MARLLRPIRRRRLRRTLTVLLVLVLVGTLLAGGYVGYVAARHAQPLALPTPSGRYPVGRVRFEWTDQHRTDALAPRPGTKRTLSIWLWYPAKAQDHGTRPRYAPGAWSELHFPGLPGLGETSFSSIRTHSRAHAAVAAGRFPIVVLEPGLGLAAPQYTTLAEDIASHGYLVAGVTPTYSANLTVLHRHAVPSTPTGNPSRFTTAAGDRLIPTWAADARFTAARAAALDHEGRFSVTSTRAGPPTSGTPSEGRPRSRPAPPTCTAREPSTSTAPRSARSCNAACTLRS